jgi:hypothetical protein
MREIRRRTRVVDSFPDGIERASRQSRALSCLVGLIFSLLFIFAATVFAATSLSGYAAQIKSCIAANGAIYMEPGKNKVEVYFGCTAARGLLAMYAVAGDTSLLNAAIRWVDWLVAHQEPEGYWYDYDNGGVTKAMPDSWDSYAALFLTVVHETGKAVGAGSFLTASRRSAMQNAFACLRGLVQSNGLTIAMPSYPAQYTMDNAEVYEGLKAAASDWRLLGVDSLAGKADSLAQVIQSNIRSRLWISGSRLYRVAIGEPVPDLSVWYPDIMAQLFPLRFGVETKDAASSVHILDTLVLLPLWSYEDFNANYANVQGIPADDVLHMAHFAKCVGDTASVSRILRGVDGISLEWPIDLYAGWRLVLADVPPTKVSKAPVFSLLSVSCFQNPFSSASAPTITSGIPLRTLALFSAQGKLIQRLAATGNGRIWRMTKTLSPGCYLLRYQAKDGSMGSARLIGR